jgi:hexosaminidase
MNRIALIILMLCSSLFAVAQPTLPLIPQPQNLQQKEGSFNLSKKLLVWCADYKNDSIKMVANNFAEQLQQTLGVKVKFTKYEKRATMTLRFNPRIHNEGYRLEVENEAIIIEAARPAGFFYALQTLKQLLPAEVLAAKKRTDKAPIAVPCVSITDEPLYSWRGFMLDEGRHFFGKDEVKRIIDIMATYKMNRFHWHLTEDQGWRIEIKKYPKLTEVAAWRNTKKLGWGSEYPTDGEHYGGFYTQDDVREIVAYAKDRFIEILPEIDMPGHFQAALAAYPELSCTPNEQHEVWLSQGVSADVMNVAAPEAIQFTKDVVDELIALFPFGYIHLGGDECPTSKWENNELCKQRLAAIGSTKFRDLQTDFYKQVQDHILAKPKAQQRKLIFWNEMLHGNTSQLKDVTVMAWIGADNAAKVAAERGFDNILTPQIPYYINRRQSQAPSEPRSQGHGTETLERVYSYIPANGIAKELLPKYKGVQANFWTEYVFDNKTLEYLAFPRLIAVAEAGWTIQARRNYTNFVERLNQHVPYFDLINLSYGKHVVPVKK